MAAMLSQSVRFHPNWEVALRPLTLLLFSVACGSGGGSPSPSPSTSSPSTTVFTVPSTGPTIAAGNIGTDGGVISSADGSVTLEIPPGALTEITEISILEMLAEELDPAPDGWEHTGTAYQLFPDGLAFSIPATMTLQLGTDTTGDVSGSGPTPLFGALHGSDGRVNPLIDSDLIFDLMDTTEMSFLLDSFSYVSVATTGMTWSVQPGRTRAVEVSDTFRVQLTMHDAGPALGEAARLGSADVDSSRGNGPIATIGDRELSKTELDADGNLVFDFIWQCSGTDESIFEDYDARWYLDTEFSLLGDSFRAGLAGYVDCVEDCTGNPDCSTETLCEDGTDDDWDGYIDCADTDCDC
jgi:hypothetical protein